MHWSLREPSDQAGRLVIFARFYGSALFNQVPDELQAVASV